MTGKGEWEGQQELLEGLERPLAIANRLAVLSE